MTYWQPIKMGNGGKMDRNHESLPELWEWAEYY